MSGEKPRDDVASLFQLTLALHHLNKGMERRFRLSLVQLFALRQLRDLPGVSLLQLATALGVHPSSLTSTMKRLGRKEYVFVSTDPKDSRKKLVSLTRQGNAALEKVEKELVSVFGESSRETSRLEETLGFLSNARRKLLVTLPFPNDA